MANTFGSYVKQRRLSLGLGLREFADLIGVEASNYSKIERGLKHAPTGDRLLPYIQALRIERNSSDHLTLSTLADCSNGNIPSQILKDELLAAKLPILFSAMSNEGFTEAQLDAMLNTVKWAHTPEPED